MRYFYSISKSNNKEYITQGGTTRLIWSYHSIDPSSPEVFTKHEYQGTRSLNLFNVMPEKDKPPLPNDTQTIDILAQNVSNIYFVTLNFFLYQDGSCSCSHLLSGDEYSTLNGHH